MFAAVFLIRPTLAGSEGFSVKTRPASTQLSSPSSPTAQGVGWGLEMGIAMQS